MTSAEQIKHTYHLLMLQKYCSLYNRGNKHEYFTVAHNANREAVEITLPSKGPWKVLVDGTQGEVNHFMLSMTIKLKFLH